jgi:NAD(P)-dependent dehydrogenase (short-subunit alcohol dehydrogenase family)
MRFKEKVVVITGGSSGIGAAAAKAFSEEGAKVALTGRDPERTTSVAGACGAIHFGLGDITDSAYCITFLDEVLEIGGGKIDVLVNGAGMIVRGDVTETTDKQWFDQLNTNVNAVFFMSREAIRRMRPEGAGAIVNVSSTCGLVGSKGLAAYCATKGALVQMTQAMALDCATDGIRINAVCPGATDTPMLFSAHAKTPSRSEMERIQVQTVPMQRMGTPVEVVRAILFLASDEAGYITGASLPVDGGYTAQ